MSVQLGSGGREGSFWELGKERRDMSICPVCGCENNIDVFRAEGRPRYALQRHTCREAAIECEKENVHFVFCGDCQFTYNKIFRPWVMDYRQDIDASRVYSGYFNDYIKSVCEQINEVYPVGGKVIVEIGCGDGQFLIELRKLFAFEGWGFDPSLVRSKRLPTYKDLRFISDYYKRDYLKKKPQLFVLRHILEHIADAREFLGAIIQGEKLEPSSIYVEVPDWEWIVDNDQVMMFSNDHCSYYSKNSLELLLSLSGFKCQKMSVTFADEYLQYFGREVSNYEVHESIQCSRDRDLGSSSNKNLTEKTKLFIGRIPEVLERFRSYFSETGNEAVLWGASGKGTILLATLGIHYDQMPFVVDSNPNKRNTYVPVTGQRVIAPEELKVIQPRYVLITNPSYYAEIASKLDSLGLKAQIIGLK